MMATQQAYPGSAPSPAGAGRRPPRRPLLWFFILAFALSWALWAVPLGPNFGPLLAAVIVISLTLGRPGLRDLLSRMTRWRVPVRWWLWALSPLAALAVTVAVLLLAGQPAPSLAEFAQFGGSGVLGALFALVVWLVGSVGEETGWRGYALPQLQRRFSPLRATLVLAVLWWLWHLQFFILEAGMSPTDPLLAVTFALYFIDVSCYAVILTWLYNRTGASLLLVIVWHALLNFVTIPGAVGVVIGLIFIVQGLVLVAAELRAHHRHRRSILGWPPPLPLTVEAAQPGSAGRQ